MLMSKGSHYSGECSAPTEMDQGSPTGKLHVSVIDYLNLLSDIVTFLK